MAARRAALEEEEDAQPTLEESGPDTDCDVQETLDELVLEDTSTPKDQDSSFAHEPEDDELLLKFVPTNEPCSFPRNASRSRCRISVLYPDDDVCLFPDGAEKRKNARGTPCRSPSMPIKMNSNFFALLAPNVPSKSVCFWWPCNHAAFLISFVAVPISNLPFFVILGL